jgi:hypothetical protein
MTKTKLASAFAALALVAAPGVALAHDNGGHGHGKKHAKKHHKRHLKVRQIVKPAGSTTTPSSTTAPAPAVTATVKSFENGDLTIALSNGKEYTAAVTDRTKIECEAAAVPTARTSDDRNGHHDDANDDDHGDRNHGDGDHNDDGHADNGQVSDDENDGEDDGGACDATALTPGTAVTEAQMVIGGSGATWKKLELVK